jgi:hypothetical protein
VKCGDGTAASGHQRKHLITGEIEVVGARLELKELEQGRISTRRRRPASTRRGRGMKWRGGPGSGAATRRKEWGVRCSVWCKAGGGVGVRLTSNVWTQRLFGEAGDWWGATHGPLWRSWASPRERKGEQSGPKENSTIF